jgi:hypothetical protein
VTRLPVRALCSFVLGIALMIPFEYTVTRVLGVAALFGAIVAGVFAIARPEWLEMDEDDADL